MVIFVQNICDEMELHIQTDCRNIDWEVVSQTLRQVGMAWWEAGKEESIFKASQAVVFIFEGEKLIGFGSAISDRLIQAALYDVAVVPEYQKRGIGRVIIENLCHQLPGCNIILYAAPGKETFYRKLGFSRMLTGMALFTDARSKRERGFTD